MGERVWMDTISSSLENEYEYQYREWELEIEWLRLRIVITNKYLNHLHVIIFMCACLR